MARKLVVKLCKAFRTEAASIQNHISKVLKMLRRAVGALAIATLAGVLGCNSGYEGLVPLNGTVTFDGAVPPAPGVVQFVALESTDGHPKRTATGQFDADGEYAASSFKESDGIYPGRYHVEVICNKRDLDYSKKDPFRDASYVADGYGGQELVVEDGSDAITLNLDVPLKKR
jgi:hypothetical protein